MSNPLSTELTVTTAHDLETRFILIECRDMFIRKRVAEHVADLPRLLRIEAAARTLLSLVENKGEPRDHPDNQALMNAGDRIAVNEGNLWLLQAAVNS